MTANILDEIVANKRQEIEVAKATRPFSDLQDEVDSLKPQRRSFKSLFKKGPVLIAEIKPKSPSAGEIIARSPLEIADLYAKSDADSISVLTDEKYFGGSLQLLQEVRKRVPQPVLRKDFIVDEYQIYETLLSEADAYLLIARILEADKLSELVSVGNALGLDHLVEIHTIDDVEKAISAGAEIVGINNRDLDTLEINMESGDMLLKMIPKEMNVVSESGFKNATDVRRVRSLGADGILVGTSILQSSDPLEKIKELKAALV